MQKLIAAAAAAAAGLGASAASAQEAPAPAAAPAGGFYVRADVGMTNGNFEGDVTASDGVTTESEEGLTDSDAGLAFGAALGYQRASGLRFEGEYFRAKNDISADEGDGTIFGAESTASAFLVNVIYDFPHAGKTGLFLGAGAGSGRFELSFQDSFGDSFSADSSALAFQLLAGIAYDISENFKLEGTLRTLGIASMDLEDEAYNATFGPGFSLRFNGTYEASTLSVGGRYTF